MNSFVIICRPFVFVSHIRRPATASPNEQAGLLLPEESNGVSGDRIVFAVYEFDSGWTSVAWTTDGMLLEVPEDWASLPDRYHCAFPITFSFVE
jgi:hypothetical protein